MSASQNGLQTKADERPSTWTATKPRKWGRIILLSILACILGGYFAAPLVKRRFSSWNESRRMERANGYFRDGEFERAILDARGILDSNPTNVEANRLIAQSLEASGTPGALSWRIRLQTLRPDDVENSLALAKGALDAGEVAMAARAVENLKSDETANPVFHEVSARLATTRGDSKAGETHWQEACRLAPGVDSYQVNLAALRIESKDPDVRSAATTSLSELAKNPENGIVALRILLSDAKKYAHPARIREATDAVVAAPGATFADRLTRLEILRQFDTPDSSAYLEEVRKLAEPNPDDFYQLLVWMNKNDLATVASEWLAGMPLETLTTPPVSIGVAQTYAKGARWDKLREMTEQGGSWGDMDYLRRAFLARALERLDEPKEGAEEWKQAVSAAQSREDAPQRLERLAIAAGTWRWQQREEDLLWRLARTGRSPRWALDSLWRFASSRSDTDQLQEIAGLIAKNAPGDVTARNHYTFLCLLTRTQEGNPHHESEVLNRDNPGNSAVAVSYALSLYQRGKMNEAVEITSALKPEDLRKPGGSFAFYHGVFLIAADRGAEADEFLRIAGNRILLPEEKAILEREKEFAKKRAEEAREGPLDQKKGHPDANGQ